MVNMAVIASAVNNRFIRISSNVTVQGTRHYVVHTLQPIVRLIISKYHRLLVGADSPMSIGVFGK